MSARNRNSEETYIFDCWKITDRNRDVINVVILLQKLTPGIRPKFERQKESLKSFPADLNIKAKT